MSTQLYCSLCLMRINPTDEDFIMVDNKIRHKSCSEEFDLMIDDLTSVYDNVDPDDDIYYRRTDWD